MTDAAPLEEPSTTSRSSETSLKQRSKRTKLIDSLLQSLESLIFAQISVLYYFDTSTFLLLIRLLSQLLWVSCGPGVLIAPPQLPPVVFVNFLAIVTHLVQGQPTADSGSRGYLHGGLLIDFVGQKRVGIWILLALDVFVFGIQILMLLAALGKYNGGELLATRTITRGTQDLDAEEAGLLRDANGQTANEEGIELDDLPRERDRIPDVDSLHAIYTGETMLVELNILQGIRALMRSRAVPPAVDSVGNGIIVNIITRLAAAPTQTG